MAATERADNFEVFHPPRRRDSRVSVYSGTTILLSARAYEDLGRPEWVVYRFAKAERIAAISPSDESDNNAYKVALAGTSARTSGRRFLRHYGIPDGRYAAKMSKEGLAFKVGPRQGEA